MRESLLAGRLGQDEKKSYRKKVLLLLLFMSLYRVVFALVFELGNDESYYWVYSQYLQWNYFDHPPMVAVLVRLFTGNLLVQTPVFLRLGSIFGCAVSSWFLFKTVCGLKDEYSGWIAVCLYNASFYAGVTAGILVIPDAPQMIFWTLSLWMISKVIDDQKNIYYWLLLGVSTGLCIMSKIHGIFLWIGLGSYILLYDRKLLRNINLYVSVLVTFIIMSPIVLWNIHNDFITYKFHSERVVIEHHLFNFRNLLREGFAEFFINNPVNIFLLLFVIFTLRSRNISKSSSIKVFNITGFLLISVVIFLSLFRDTRAIWSGPGYVSLIPFTAIGISEIRGKVFERLKYLALVVFITGGIVVFSMIYFKTGTFSNIQGSEVGKGDITLDEYGWAEAGAKFGNIYKDQVARGLALPGSPMVTNSWWGAHDEYYFCRPLGITMIGLGPVMNLHEYAWANSLRLKNVNMANAFCVIHSDELFNINQAFGSYYSTIDSIATIPIMRLGKESHAFIIYRLSGWKNLNPVQK